jgi:2',3'-cyclic-nucleotide 2'-phosphodiesterase (5'-nucleotidase family)
VAGLKPYVVVPVAGVRVAVVGVVTERTGVVTHPENIRGVEFLPAGPAVARALRELRGKADAFVVLSHLGYPQDRKLAAEVPGIDVILGGHTHTRIDSPARVGRTLIAQAWEHGKVLGVVELAFEGKRLVRSAGRLEPVGPATSGSDPEMEALVGRHARALEAALGETVAIAGEDLEGEGARRRETALGDLVADAVRRAAGAEVAIVNGGGIRASIRQGTVRLKELYTALPYENYVVAFDLSGRDLKRALEHGVAAAEHGDGRFPQVSGLRFTWSPSANPGRRIRKVLIAGRPLEPERRYRVATHDFLAAGGDGYRIFVEARRGSVSSGRRVRDLVAEALKQSQTVLPPPAGRILEEAP